jgi:hypothetical protein
MPLAGRRHALALGDLVASPRRLFCSACLCVTLSASRTAVRSGGGSSHPTMPQATTAALATAPGSQGMGFRDRGSAGMFMRWRAPRVEDLPQQSVQRPVPANLPHQHHDNHSQGGRETDGERGDQTGHLLFRNDGTGTRNCLASTRSRADTAARLKKRRGKHARACRNRADLLDGHDVHQGNPPRSFNYDAISAGI